MLRFPSTSRRGMRTAVLLLAAAAAAAVVVVVLMLVVLALALVLVPQRKAYLEAIGAELI